MRMNFGNFSNSDGGNFQPKLDNHHNHHANLEKKNANMLLLHGNGFAIGEIEWFSVALNADTIKQSHNVMTTKMTFENG